MNQFNSAQFGSGATLSNFNPGQFASGTALNQFNPNALSLGTNFNQPGLLNQFQGQFAANPGGSFQTAGLNGGFNTFATWQGFPATSSNFLAGRQADEADVPVDEADADRKSGRPAWKFVAK